MLSFYPGMTRDDLTNDYNRLNRGSELIPELKEVPKLVGSSGAEPSPQPGETMQIWLIEAPSGAGKNAIGAGEKVWNRIPTWMVPSIERVVNNYVFAIQQLQDEKEAHSEKKLPPKKEKYLQELLAKAERKLGFNKETQMEVKLSYMASRSEAWFEMALHRTAQQIEHTATNEEHKKQKQHNKMEIGKI